MKVQSVGKKGLAFKNACLHIIGNVLKCGEYSIPISSISRIYTGDLPKRSRVAEWILSALAVACLVLDNRADGRTFFYIAVALIVFAIIKAVSDIDGEGLVIEINTGFSYGFKSHNAEFATQVANKIELIIGGEATAFNLTADFERSTLSSI